jgi:hypothetical protein
MQTDPTLAGRLFPGRDVTLRRIVATLSEPESGKPADNLLTNEDSFAVVTDQLDGNDFTPHVYLGVGPDQNLTYLAHARPALGFILDFRRRNALWHLLHKALITLAPDRARFLELLTARHPLALPRDPTAAQLVTAFQAQPFDRAFLEQTTRQIREFLEPLGAVAVAEWAELATIHARLAGPGLSARFLALPMYPTLGRLMTATDRQGHPAHFLAHEPLYQSLRVLETNDRVIPLVGDFAGDRAMPALGGWLRDRKLRVGMLYISDVEFFLLRGGKFPAYLNNLRALPWAEGAVVIRASTREIPHPERRKGESSTTILRPVAALFEATRAGRMPTLDELFK